MRINIKQLNKSILKILVSLLLCENASIAGPGLSSLPLVNQGRFSLAPMLKKTTPSVVNIKIFNKQRYLRLLKEQEAIINQNPHRAMPKQGPALIMPDSDMVGMGSGVIINARDGIIITNNHVINDAESIIVTLHDGRRINATLVGTDPDSDLAVLKITADGLTALKFADSEKIEISDFVVAIGSPFGLNQTVTSGIISGKGRAIGLEGYEDFIQTDASINPGNSGGALINLRGELIGINTAILAPDGVSIGIGFAIPSNMANSITEQLIRFGKVRRGLLGVVAQTLSPELATAFGDAKQKGAIIDTIAHDSIAYNSQLKVGDIIEEINGHPISSAAELRNVIGLIPINSNVNIKLIRNKKPVSIKLQLLDPKEIQTQAQKIYSALAGAYLDPIEKFSIPHMGSINGIKLLEVTVDSPAWQQGLRPNDIIISANNEKTTSIKELDTAIKNKADPLLLQIIRNNTSFYMAIKPAG